MVYLYASDITKEKRTDAFLGEGTEQLIKEAEEKGEEVIIGTYWENSERFTE